MKNFLTRYKVELTVVFGLLVLAFAVWLTWNLNKSKPAQVIPPSTGPTITKTPKEDFEIPYIPVEAKSFNVVSVSPEPEKGVYGASQEFTITFSDPVKPNAMLIGTKDSHPLRITQGSSPNQIVVAPKTFWTIEKDYSIIISPQSESENGKLLKEPYEFIFRIEAPRVFGEGY